MSDPLNPRDSYESAYVERRTEAGTPPADVYLSIGGPEGSGVGGPPQGGPGVTSIVPPTPQGGPGGTPLVTPGVKVPSSELLGPQGGSSTGTPRTGAQVGAADNPEDPGRAPAPRPAPSLFEAIGEASSEAWGMRTFEQLYAGSRDARGIVENPYDANVWLAKALDTVSNALNVPPAIVARVLTDPRSDAGLPGAAPEVQAEFLGMKRDVLNLVGGILDPSAGGATLLTPAMGLAIAKIGSRVTRMQGLLKAPPQIGKGLREAIGFVSPNVEEGLKLPDALQRLGTPGHIAARESSEAILHELGLRGKVSDAVGDWSDGAENTLVVAVENAPDLETFRYGMARMGKVQNQKAVIPFIKDEKGPDLLYRFTLPAPIEATRDALDKAGLVYKTLEPAGDATKVTIFDKGGELKDTVRAFAREQKVKPAVIAGEGEFLGTTLENVDDAAARADATRVYDEVIADFESRRRGLVRPGGQPPGDGVSDVRGLGAGAGPGGDAGPLTGGLDAIDFVPQGFRPLEERAAHVLAKGGTLEDLERVRPDAVTVGAVKIARNLGRTFDDFKAAMIGEYGPDAAAKLNLEDLYQESSKEFKKLIDKVELPKLERLLELLAKGEFGSDWYYGTVDELKRWFGPDALIVSKFIAAFSPRTAVKSHVKLALDAYTQWKTRGIVPQTKGMMGSHLGNVENTLAGAEMSGPKVFQFDEGVRENLFAIALDTWMGKAGIRATGPKGIKAPYPDQLYPFLSQWTRDMMLDLGQIPRDAQSILWHGIQVEWLIEKKRDLEKGIAKLKPLRDIVESQVKSRLKSSPAFKRILDGLPKELTDEQKTKLGTIMVLSGLAATAALAEGTAEAADRDGDQPGDGMTRYVVASLVALGLGAAATPAIARAIARVAKDPRTLEVLTGKLHVDQAKVSQLTTRIAELTAQREAVLTRVNALEDTVRISKQEALAQGHPELEGQVPWTKHHDSILPDLYKVNGELADAERALEAEQNGGLLTPLMNERGAIRLGQRRPIVIPNAGDVAAFEALHPGAVKVGTTTVAVDWNAIGQGANLDEAFNALAAFRGPEVIDAARRGVITADKRKELANLVGMTPEDLLRVPTGTAMNAEQLQATIDLVGSGLKYLTDLSERLAAAKSIHAPNTELLRQEFAVHLGVMGKLIERFAGARAEAGRSLQTLAGAPQQLAGTPFPAVSAITDLHERGLLINPDEAAEYLATLKTPQEMGTFLQWATNPLLHAAVGATVGGIQGNESGNTTVGAVAGAAAGLLPTQAGRNILREAWVNGLLATFKGNAANLASNSIAGVSAVTERALGAAWSAARRAGNDQRVFFGETPAMLQGALAGFTEAVIAAGRTLKSGVPSTMQHELARPRALSSEALHMTGVPGMAVDLLGTAITTPSRILLSADEFFKTINRRMELWAHAYRSGASQGLDGAQLSSFMERFMTNPPENAMKAADAAANYATFSQDLEGPLRGLQTGFSAAWPVVPFFKTPVNLFKWNLERVPGAQLMVKAFRDDMAAGGTRRDMALAKFALGGMVTATAAALVVNGTVTGRGPLDPEQNKMWRAAGNVPYSVKLFGTSYGINRFDTYGSILGMVADTVQISGELRPENYEAHAAAVTLAVSGNLLSKTYLEGLSEMLETIMSRDPNALSRSNWFKSLARTMVPSGIRQIESQADPIVRQTYSWLDEVYAGIPGWSADLYPRRNLFGDPVVSPPGFPAAATFASPVPVGTPKDDAVIAAFLDNKLSIPIPPPYLFGANPNTVEPVDAKDGIPLSPEQYDRFVWWAGNGLKVPAAGITEALDLPASALGGKDKLGMRDLLGVLVQSKFYQEKLTPGPDGSRALAIRKIVSGYREWAKATVLQKYPEVAKAYLTQQLVTKPSALMGPDFKAPSGTEIDELVKGLAVGAP